MSFNDDEPIVGVPGVSGGKASSPSKFGIKGRMRLEIINKKEAPLEASNFKALVELTGEGLGKERMGVDLVTVLDLSSSMQEEKKLVKLKRAMQFLIKKLGPVDRLSVVTYSNDSMRLCPLRQVTQRSQPEIGKLVDGLVAKGGSNIGAGLETALKVLRERKLSKGRVTAIMIMSDGKKNRGDDPSKVQTGKVPVYTFGYGEEQDAGMLKAIADNSDGGTFSDVQDLNNLSIAFSQCLAGLLTVAVQDLKLTITAGDSIKINKRWGGSYPITRDNTAGSVTVSFGDLYDKEVRKVVVDLLLPKVDVRTPGVDVITVSYTYSADGTVLDSSPAFATVTRTDTKEPERKEVVDELNRLRTLDSIKEARKMADDQKLDKARDKLAGAQKLLQSDKPNQLIKALLLELEMLVGLMASQDIYDALGRSFALSSETSHARQRFAARGAVGLLRLFATPRMDKFLEQAKSFDKDPSIKLPTEEEDVKQEMKEHPPPDLSTNAIISKLIRKGIKLLNSIDEELNRNK